MVISSASSRTSEKTGNNHQQFQHKYAVEDSELFSTEQTYERLKETINNNFTCNCTFSQ